MSICIRRAWEQVYSNSVLGGEEMSIVEVTVGHYRRRFQRAISFWNIKETSSVDSAQKSLSPSTISTAFGLLVFVLVSSSGRLSGFRENWLADSWLLQISRWRSSRSHAQ